MRGAKAQQTLSVQPVKKNAAAKASKSAKKLPRT
jgi:hypothetical protein